MDVAELLSINLEYFEEKLAVHWNLLFTQFHSICIPEKFLMLVHWRGERQTKKGELWEL